MCMDSRSGPELPNKVHVFGKTVKLHHPIPRSGLRFGLILLVLAVVACGGGTDPRSVEGALGRAADALAQRDARELFRVIDQRARHALAAISESRRAAAALIQESYPAAARASAISELGDGAQAKDAADLFRMRCDAACLDGLSQQVGAPVETQTQGADVTVKTSRGSELRLHRGSDTWYGIVWNTDALSRERDRATAELDQVKANATVYRQQNELHP